MSRSKARARAPTRLASLATLPAARFARGGRDGASGSTGVSPDVLRFGNDRLLAQRERQHDVLGRLFELSTDRGTHGFGEVAQPLRLDEPRVLHGYRDQPPIVPIVSDSRFHAGRAFEIALDRPRVARPLGHGVDGIASRERERERKTTAILDMEDSDTGAAR